MSTDSMTVSVEMTDRPSLTTKLATWHHRCTPSQGWLTLALLLASLGTVAESITAEKWVPTPGLMGVLFLSVISGLSLSKIRLPAPLLHFIALVVGLVILAFQSVSLADDPNFIGGLREILARLDAWYENARTGSVSTDLMPISMIILGLTWILGHISSWFVFRSDTAWVAVILGGLAILSNLSFLPDELGWKFFSFLFFSMLLVVRVNVVHKQNIWRRERTTFSPHNAWQAMHIASWVSMGIVLLAAFMPLKVVVSYELAGIWGAARQPVVSLEDAFVRLTSGIPCRKNFGCEFGENLPLTGKVSFGEHVIFEATTEYPSYWLARTYSEYTSSGWISGKTEPLSFGPDTILPPQTDLQKRVPVQQVLKTKVDTSEFLVGGKVDNMSHQVVAETLSPKTFTIDLQDSTDDSLLPDDLHALANDLRQSLIPPPNSYLESFISRRLPDDLVLTKVTTDDSKSIGFVQTVTVQRKSLSVPDIVSWRLEKGLRENQGYSMVSLVSVAEDSDLTGAYTSYSGFIKDHYLQLPPSLPRRVKELAQDLTQDLTTPFSKVLAIQSFLRGPNFGYSHDIEAPPRGKDGVDYFLFESKLGYSAYFASAMAVMLRTVDIPSRLAAGYAPGEYDPEVGSIVVKDSDSHGWVQVYFPNYGWIDFEPTASFPSPSRMIDDGSGLNLDSTSFGDDTVEDEASELDPLEQVSGLEPTTPSEDFSRVTGAWQLIMPTAIVLGPLTLASILFGIAWSRILSGSASVERLYSRLSRLGRLAGVSPQPNRTPLEVASAIERAIPDVGPGSRQIAWAYASYRYGRIIPSAERQREINKTWKRIRVSMLSRAFARLIGR